jgi:glutathione S-transferase
VKLYYTKSSPYANNVRMVISEIGITEQVEFIECHPFANDNEFLAVSSLGKVPCLVDAGETIADSEVICDYLDASYTGGTLFNTIYADWRLKTLYSICSGLMDCCVARRVEVVRAKDNTQSEFWLKRHTDAILRGINDIDSRLALLPEEFSILHINLLSCLAYLDFRHQDIDWRASSEALKDFYDEFSVRACFVDNLLSD